MSYSTSGGRGRGRGRGIILEAFTARLRGRINRALWTKLGEFMPVMMTAAVTKAWLRIPHSAIS